MGVDLVAGAIFFQYWESQILLELAYSRSNVLKKNAHNQTFFFFFLTTVLHLPSWNFCLACLLQNSAFLSHVPAAEFCISVSCACCRILLFCLACLLHYSELLSCVPAAKFCTSVSRACCRILRFCLACLLQNSAQAQQIVAQLSAISIVHLYLLDLSLSLCSFC